MTVLEFVPLVLIAAAAAGFLGSLTGLGGGVVITPVLTLFFHVNIKYAIGASLISVIATSSGSAAAYVRDGLSSIRIGMFLEIATTLGAITGAFIAPYIPTAILSILFGLVLLHSAWQASQQPHEPNPSSKSDALATSLRLNGEYTANGRAIPYMVCRVKAGFALMFGAGTISGLLGIGSGSLKVIAMDQIMQIPFKVSTATSNFMIGVTAAASASLYLTRGYVNPVVTLPVLLGVLLGATLGARVLPQLPVPFLRKLFAIVVAAMAVQMIWHGFHSHS